MSLSHKLKNNTAVVIDASASMSFLEREVVNVVDGLVSYLAQRSKELDQETRISVYMFNNNVTCLVFDTDVLRLPSIKQSYRTNGMTALLDATGQALDDLAKIPQIYGDHAFLTYVITDGQENNSKNHDNETMSRKLKSLAENQTVAVLVPNQMGVFEAKKFGFPAENIAVWDATSIKGVAEAGETIKTATNNYMINRSRGVRSTTTLFTMDPGALNKQAIKDADLKALPFQSYNVIEVKAEGPIRQTVEAAGIAYHLGIAFYQLNKREMIQAQKKIAIRHRKTGRYYVGQGARDLLGLPNEDIRVSPDHNPDYEVFVQSTSVNRKLLGNTRLLVLTLDAINHL